VFFFLKTLCFLKNRAIFKKIVFFLSCGRGLKEVKKTP
jgi:hypothetical protein